MITKIKILKELNQMNICIAKENGFCFGCDDNSIENIEKNHFEYYEIQKECKTLKTYRERN